MGQPKGYRPPAAGIGRTKGIPNKSTTLLKDAILQAASEAGGTEGLVGYLKAQAIKNPGAFLPLVGKVLPMQLTGEDGGPVLIVTGVKRAEDLPPEPLDERVAAAKERMKGLVNGMSALALKARDADH